VEVKDVGINWLAAAAYLVERIPFEKMLSRPKDKSEYMAELKEILKESQKSTPAPNKVEVKASANSTSNVTTKETVDYQNREMGKVLIQMERHAAQGLRIAGKPCDCLSKHMVDLEALAEETITMVSNPEIYLQIIDWVRSIAPKTTVEANESGLYAQEYPVIARQARDFRKELLGTLDYKVLFNWDKTLEDIHKEKTAGKKSPRRKKITEMKIPPELAQENPFAPDTIIPDAAETPENMHKNMPETKVITKNVEGIGGVDAGIADNIKYLNDHGFKTAQSHSGLSSDHIGRGTDEGYIAFFKSDLTPEKIRVLKNAAERANLTWDEDEIFFQPAITVRTAKLKSGKGYYEVLKEANIESGLEPGKPDFMDKLKVRETLMRQKLSQNGGYLFTTDAENKAAFDQFIRNLNTLQNLPKNAEYLTGVPPQPQVKVKQPKETEDKLIWYKEPGGAIQADAVEFPTNKRHFVIEVYRDIETGGWNWLVQDGQRGWNWHGLAKDQDEATYIAANSWYTGVDPTAKDDTKEPEGDTSLAPNGTACPNLQTMTEWVQSEDTAKCRECMLTITVPWYYEELEAQGEKELAEDMQKVQQEGDPVKVAAALDQIKEQVKPEVKQRLLEFDCASQSFEI
jgi:hypothetical protein